MNNGIMGNQLAPGTVLRGRYQLSRLLGQGGFGITYCALDTRTGRQVAIKEHFPNRYVLRGQDGLTVQAKQGMEEDFSNTVKSFVQEAQTLINLQSMEGVVQLFHVFDENKTAYYVMELLEGEELKEFLLRTGPMTWENLTPIMKTVIKALGHIHEAGLIHRDISPDNIFLTPQGARVIDFGSVRSYQGRERFTAYLKHSFAPIEQYQSGGKQGPWTDIYALCVTMYYCLSGELPPAAVLRVDNDALKPLETICPRVPKEVCQVIHRGMAVDSRSRYQTVEQLYEALFHEHIPRNDHTDKQEEVTQYRETSQQPDVRCVRGEFAGSSWQIPPGKGIRIGRNPECEVCYPPNSSGISRRQCSFYKSPDGKIMIRDDNSSYGTFVLVGNKPVRIEAGKWYLAQGARVFFGRQEEYLIK